MKASAKNGQDNTWDIAACDALAQELWELRDSMLLNEARAQAWIQAADPSHTDSAVNLSHYLALRRADLRHMQERLARLGLSSLGRSETHALANLDKVLGILHRLGGRPWSALSEGEPAGSRRGPALLEAHTFALFGAAPPERAVRIMVTLPSHAATDESFIDDLVAAGMDVARINCAHDAADDWRAMANSVRRASRMLGRPVRVLMDLGGPKLRTGPIAGSQEVARVKATKDALGCVTRPGRLGLRAQGSTSAVPGADLCIGVDATWLAQLEPGARIDLVDARGARRRLKVVYRQSDGVLVESKRSVYITADTMLGLHGDRAETVTVSRVGDLPTQPGALLLHRGDKLNLVLDGLGHGPVPATNGKRAKPATLACTLPEALEAVRKGERIWFDDGRIGGVVRRRTSAGLEVEITHAREAGERLLADKGINLPDTRLELPALTEKDLEDLEVVASCADIVGLSFAQSAADVRQLRQRLVDLGAGQVGMILKIETRRGFEHLPEMLMAALASPTTGVMIARGDLAVECGYERLAEIQEEILWACEAAHVPVIWATQVLETLTKTGLPSRAEVTDAAMSERAECVMLNKGPHILDAIRTLDDILRRMATHQSKKRHLMRALKAWASLPEFGKEPSKPLPSQADVKRRERRTSGAGRLAKPKALPVKALH